MGRKMVVKSIATAENRMTNIKENGRDSRSIVKQHASEELIFALVGYLGSASGEIADLLAAELSKLNYEVVILSAREEIEKWAASEGKSTSKLRDGDSLQHAQTLQDWGDEMRVKGDHARIARALIRSIRMKRGAILGQEVKEGLPVAPDGKRRAYLLDSLRHPAEVELLRHVYGRAFALIGIVCSEEQRKRRLQKRIKDAGDDLVRALMDRDADAEEKHGQHVLDAFHLADYFIDSTENRMLIDPKTQKKKPNPHWQIPSQLKRLIQILSQTEVTRPTIEESAIYMAHGAKMKSACLSRQVGACIIDARGNVIGIGANDVPQAGGGTYSDHPRNGVQDERCAMNNGYCSNTRQQNIIVDNLLNIFGDSVQKTFDRKSMIKSLRKAGLGQLLEFSRAVHAEMEALLSAARQGKVTVGARMFVTTFPCHYCARHIVSAGIDEVQYIEPYSKSQAFDLHSDSITDDPTNWKAPSQGGAKLLLQPFTGVAPRLYPRAFLKDRELKDSDTGVMKIGTPDWGSPWHLPKVSYIQLEAELSIEEDG